MATGGQLMKGGHRVHWDQDGTRLQALPREKKLGPIYLRRKTEQARESLLKTRLVFRTCPRL